MGEWRDFTGASCGLMVVFRDSAVNSPMPVVISAAAGEDPGLDLGCSPWVAGVYPLGLDMGVIAVLDGC
jgi:hypothetical protein